MTTIRGRLLTMLLVGLLLVLTAGGAAVYWITSTSLVRQLDASLTTRASTLISLISYESGQLKLDVQEAPFGSDTFFELRKADGELLHRSRSLGSLTLPSPPDDLRHGPVHRDVPALSARSIALAFQPTIDDEDDEPPAGERATAITLPWPEIERLLLTVAVDRRPLDRALALLLATLGAVGVTVAVTVALLVSFGVTWGLAPLERLRVSLEGVDGATVSARFEERGAPAELLPIYAELNEMLGRVETAIERERAFVSAAAHELRTPLAELRTTAEVAMRWPDPERTAAALQEVLAIGLEMERLVETLLLLSRTHASTAAVGTPIQVAPIARVCLERRRPDALAKQLELALDLDDTVLLPGPAGVLEIMAGNLIGNAIDHSPAGGSVAIRCTIVAGRGELTVENGPVTLRPADLPRLFEPFWRLDEARSDRRHIGLGLSVVRHLAGVIGVQVTASLSADGDRLRVSLATADTEPPDEIA